MHMPGRAPFHEIDLGEAADFESLMRRLSRALLLPEAHDPHPWVAKGRRLFFGSTMQGCADPAASAPTAADSPGLIGDPASLRRVASLLGNDIGQMRLSFNAKTYRVQPTYRDDNQWLWQPSGAVTGLDSTALELPAQAHDGVSGAASSASPGGKQASDPPASTAIEAHRLDRSRRPTPRPMAAAGSRPSSKFPLT